MLQPQVYSLPLDKQAECENPASTLSTFTDYSIIIYFGLTKLSSVPCPSCPDSPNPHVYIIPASSNARVCIPPAEVSTIFMFYRSDTIYGLLVLCFVPCPSYPMRPCPQVYSFPAWVTAAVWFHPHDITATECLSDIEIGDYASASWSFPRRPSFPEPHDNTLHS